MAKRDGRGSCRCVLESGVSFSGGKRVRKTVIFGELGSNRRKRELGFFPEEAARRRQPSAGSRHLRFLGIEGPMKTRRRGKPRVAVQKRRGHIASGVFFVVYWARPLQISLEVA